MDFKRNGTNKVVKKKLLELAKEKVNSRLMEAKKAMEASQNAANEDTKSSAGDKFETSRAMAHNDLNLYTRQWHEAKMDWDILEGINPDNVMVLAGLGSLVRTSIGQFFFATSIGVLDVDKNKVMVASMASPIGEAIQGKRTGEAFEFRNKKVLIQKVS